MIAYIEGTILKKEADRIVLLANHLGYEVVIPAVTMAALADREIGDPVSLSIFYHQTERQPKPVLIGFQDDAEKEFFQLFISVEAIGPLKAVKALDVPMAEIAAAIEARDVAALTRLNGIGKRTAQKIVATLEGKMAAFAAAGRPAAAPEADRGDMIDQVLNVLVSQLGHRPAEARQLIKAALQRNPAIQQAEALFEEVYRSGDTP